MLLSILINTKKLIEKLIAREKSETPNGQSKGNTMSSMEGFFHQRSITLMIKMFSSIFERLIISCYKRV